MERYICIHGHFYQPPRENPWLEAIELQDSAYPYHDWNERIAAECYAPNAVARVLDAEGRIVKLVNNYAHISFDFGPTLLSWLEAQAPEVYRAILDADRASLKSFSGHGSALAQAYNHIILPLANSRDRRTQILWGIKDFEKRFQRAPEGMWLPETAVDMETLELLAAHGIRFTILAPHQAALYRAIGASEWTSTADRAIDAHHAYEQKLPSGNSIALFFYHGTVARAVAFENLLSQGEQFIGRLMDGFSPDPNGVELVHIATDGESYGHHHRFGDMALAFTLDQIEARGQARLTNYGEFLAKHPPRYEVQIAEKTSWSCAHGIDRWWSDCGCNSGGHPGWTQSWRTPLRNALDHLRDTVSPQWQQKASEYFKNGWYARDSYIDVILDRSPANVENFLTRHAARPLTPMEKTTAVKLLELQRQAQLMYTSCGWFFDELSGIETVQVMQFAARAAQLAQELFGDALEEKFVERLAKAQSNLAEQGSGREIFDKFVIPARVDWPRAGAHYAVNLLFESLPDHARIYCYRAERRSLQTYRAGAAKLAVGAVELTSEITGERADLCFGAIHMGDHNVYGGVRPYLGEAVETYLAKELTEPFSRADFPEVIRLMDRRFEASNFTLRSLFRDEQRKLLNEILDAALRETETHYRQIYEHRAPLMRFLKSLSAPPPKGFVNAAEFIINRDLQHALQAPEVDGEKVKQLLATAKIEDIALDTTTLEFALRRTIEAHARRLDSAPSLEMVQTLDRLASLLPTLPFKVNLWLAQNIYYRLAQTMYRDLKARAPGDPDTQTWLTTFAALGSKLGVKPG